MKVAVVAGSVLVLCTIAHAQITLPRGHLSNDGKTLTSGTNTIGGLVVSGRMQIAEGGFWKVAMTIRRMGFRLDGGHVYTSQTGMGRKWNSVLLRVSNTDSTKLTSTFSTNLVSPQTVFRDTMAWPTITGKRKFPASWWDTRHSFPFSKPFVTNGKDHVLWDMTFTGGTLHNGYRGHRAYVLDSADTRYNPPITTGRPKFEPAFNSTKCADPAVGISTGAFVWGETTSYNNVAPANLRHSSEIAVFSMGTAPGQAVIHAIGAVGNLSGIDVKAGCNKLYLNLAAPWVAFVRKVPANDSNGYSGLSKLVVPHSQIDPSNKTVWMQAAWSNSKTGQFSLTIASHHIIPGRPSDGLDRVMVFNNSSAAATTGILKRLGTSSGWAFPVTRYAGK